MMRGEPGLSVIVVTDSRPEMLRRCLDSLDCQGTADLEAVVVDSSPSLSADPTTLVRDRPWIRYMHVGRISHSMQMARNLGIMLARAPIVAFIDDDCFVRPTWAANLLELFGDPDVAAVGGRVVDRRWEHDEPHFAFEGDVGVVLADGTVVSRFSSITNGPIKVQHLPGGNSAVRRDIAIAVGGFDVRYGGTSFREDTDFYYRLWQKGHNLLYWSDIEVYHFAASKQGHGFGNRDGAEARYWEARNHAQFARNVVGVPIQRLLFKSIKGALTGLSIGASSEVLRCRAELAGAIRGLSSRPDRSGVSIDTTLSIAEADLLSGTAQRGDGHCQQDHGKGSPE